MATSKLFGYQNSSKYFHLVYYRSNMVTLNVMLVMLHCGHKVETLQGDMHERERAEKCSFQQVGSQSLSLWSSTDSLPQLLHLAFPLSAWFPPFVICPGLRGWGRDMSCPSDHKYQWFVFDLSLWWTARFLWVENALFGQLFAIYFLTSTSSLDPSVFMFDFSFCSAC